MNSPAAARTRTVRILRTFNAPAKAVWEAWTQADRIKKWWAPREYTCPSAELDVRVGGKYLAAMRAKDGKTTWSTGTYREVVPQQRLVHTDHFADEKGNIISPAEAGMPGDMPTELLVTVTFTEQDSTTTMNLIHSKLPREMVADRVQGWNECFDKLARTVER